jgi:hypothetical protein
MPNPVPYILIPLSFLVQQQASCTGTATGRGGSEVSHGHGAAQSDDESSVARLSPIVLPARKGVVLVLCQLLPNLEMHPVPYLLIPLSVLVQQQVSCTGTATGRGGSEVMVMGGPIR